jgi:hypothetical protein
VVNSEVVNRASLLTTHHSLFTNHYNFNSRGSHSEMIGK